MGFLSIFGKITLDSSGAQAAFKSTEKAADKFANKLRNQVGGALLGAFTIRSLVGFGKELIEKGVTVDKLAKKFNLTTDEVQLLQKEAERTGESFESLVKDAGALEATLKRIGSGDVLLSRQQIEQLTNAKDVIQEFEDQAAIEFAKAIESPGGFFSKLITLAGPGGGGRPEGPVNTSKQDAFLAEDAAKKRAAETDFQKRVEASKVHMAIQDKILEDEKELAKLKFDALTKEQKLNELLKQRAEVMDKFRFPNTPQGTLANEVEQARLNNAISALRGEAVKTDTGGPSIISDSLRSVGNFLGSDPNSGVTRKLSDMHRELQEIRRNTSRVNNGGSMFPL